MVGEEFMEWENNANEPDEAQEIAEEKKLTFVFP
jgi:hypothetical protein